MRIPSFVRALLAVTAAIIIATPANAQAVSGQGTWETTLLGRDINLHEVAATSAAAVYLYDTTLKVTWLRNANVNGWMDWTTANAWAANLITGSGVTAISDWRLPTMAANPNPYYSYDGSTAVGYNVSGNTSEMSSLFFNTLGNKAYLNTGGVAQAGYGLTNAGSFQNMVSSVYWSGTENAGDPSFAWYFYPNTGLQGLNSLKTTQLGAMAVRTGDVAAVPEPETYAMLLAGLGLIGAIARRRHSSNSLVAQT